MSKLIKHFGGWRQPHVMWATRPRYRLVAPAPLPRNVDLSGEFPPVRDQGAEGACTAFAWTGALQHMAMKEKLSWAAVEPSEQAFYWNERVHGQYDINQDTGASLSDGAWVAMNIGCMAEGDFPYVAGGFATPPPSGKQTIDLATVCLSVYQNALDIKGALADGFGVPFGVVVYSSFEDADDGNIPMPNVQAEQVLGGHAIVLVGYDDDKQEFKFRNSWSSGWGQNGYGLLPYAYVLSPDLASDFWSPRVIK